MRGPPLKQIVQWILKASSDLDKKIIIKSFRCCALSIQDDGSEDNEMFQSRKNTELWLRTFESCNGCNSIHPENGIEMELSLKWVYVIGGDKQVILATAN